jgi:DNA-binding transcriptional LysR family regulator
MDLRQVESFFWIATFGSFSAAAKRLYISQSAISTRILSLEKNSA